MDIKELVMQSAEYPQRFLSDGELGKLSDFIKEQEGTTEYQQVRGYYDPESQTFKARQDDKGIWTIGYGSTITSGIKVKKGDTISLSEAEDLLRHTIKEKTAQTNIEFINKYGKGLHDLSSDSKLLAIDMAYQLGPSELTNKSATLVPAFFEDDWATIDKEYIIEDAPEINVDRKLMFIQNNLDRINYFNNKSKEWEQEDNQELASADTNLNTSIQEPESSSHDTINIFNNPGNIEIGQGYDGETGEGYEGGKIVENGRFAVFVSKEMGIRALAKDLTTKIKRFDGDVEKIITQYAPPNENDTTAYIKFVKAQLNNQDKITINDLAALTKAIILKENKPELSKLYLVPEVFNKGIMLSKSDKVEQSDKFKQFEEKDKKESLKKQKIVYDAMPDLVNAIQTQEIPKEKIKGFVTDAASSKLLSEIGERIHVPEFIENLGIDVDVKGKDEFAIKGKGLTYKQKPGEQSVSGKGFTYTQTDEQKRLEKKFGKEGGITGSVGISKSDYGNEKTIGGQINIPTDKIKEFIKRGMRTDIEYKGQNPLVGLPTVLSFLSKHGGKKAIQKYGPELVKQARHLKNNPPKFFKEGPIIGEFEGSLRQTTLNKFAKMFMKLNPKHMITDGGWGKVRIHKRYGKKENVESFTDMRELYEHWRKGLIGK